MWNWPLIDHVAETLGVSLEARKHWRKRKSVPHRWRLKILQASKGKVRVFENRPAPSGDHDQDARV